MLLQNISTSTNQEMHLSLRNSGEQLEGIKKKKENQTIASQ